MKTIKKNLLAALGLSFFKATSTLAAGAAFFTDVSGAKPDAAAEGNFGDRVTDLINYFLGILGLIAVAFIIYAGVLMVTAGGDDDAIGKGKKIITYAVIGIIIVLISWTIVRFVTFALG